MIQNSENIIKILPPSVQLKLEEWPSLSDFEEKEQLGKGSFGRVFKAVHKESNKVYAIKELDKKRSDKENCNREIEIMYKLNHINIVKLYSHFETTTFLYFVMEYCNEGNLFSARKEQRSNKFNDKKAAYYLASLVNAINHLHCHNPQIIHRDIKLENLLLVNSNSGSSNCPSILKLTDFGWSAFLYLEEYRSTFCGTKAYMPPEIINNQVQNHNVDIWCIGVLLFELTTGKLPFTGDDFTVRNNIIMGKIEWVKDMNPQLKDLISKILKTDPNKRLSLKEILEHNYITENLKKLSQPELDIIISGKTGSNDINVNSFILNKNPLLESKENDDLHFNLDQKKSIGNSSKGKNTDRKGFLQIECVVSSTILSNKDQTNNDSELKKLLGKLLEENTNLKRELKSKTERLNYELKKTREELDKKYVEVIEIKGNNEDLTNQVDELTMALQSKESTLKSYENELRERNGYIRMIEDKYSRKSTLNIAYFNPDEEMINSLRIEKDKFAKSYDLLEQDYDKTFVKLKILEYLYNDVSNELKESEEKITRPYKKLLENYEKKLQDAEKEIYFLSKEIKILKQEKELILCVRNI